VAAYRKPVILLVDEFTASAGEVMAAVLQDAGRVTTVGARTAGAGGAVSTALAGVYSEAEVSLAIALGFRSKDVITGDLPTAPLIENIGIRPDIALDIMTRDNLMNKGKPYLDRVLEIAAEKIQAAR
jgi:C-terminal processing protease CtpA/Prc